MDARRGAVNRKSVPKLPRGVGQAAAIMMAKEGAKVVVNDLDAGPAEETVKKIQEIGGQALAFPGSVTDKDFPDRIMKKTYDEFGQIDILLNCAGMNQREPIAQVKPET